MLFLTRQPASPVSRFVEYLWYLRCGPHRDHSRERVPPAGTVELVIDLRDDSTLPPESLLIGPHSESFVFDTDIPFDVIGAHFRPAGTFPFLGAPAAEFNNQRIDLSDVWGTSVVESLRQRFLDCPRPDDRLRILEEVLKRRLSDPRRGHPAVALALPAFQKVPQSLSISQVIESTGLSSTRFVHLFRREVGMTPKLFCRIQRFQEASRRIGPCDDHPVWADLALDCGYCDQAHFAREFRAFSGSSPTAYLTRQTALLHHVRDGGLHARTVVKAVTERQLGGRPRALLPQLPVESECEATPPSVRIPQSPMRALPSEAKPR